jgi:hypothetical protein
VSWTGKKNLSVSTVDVKNATKGLTALTPEMDCDQTAMGFLPITFVVFLKAKLF